MTKEGLDRAKAILEKWRQKETDVCLFRGIPLSYFTKDELIILITRITNGMLFRNRK